VDNVEVGAKPSVVASSDTPHGPNRQKGLSNGDRMVVPVECRWQTAHKPH